MKMGLAAGRHKGQQKICVYAGGQQHYSIAAFRKVKAVTSYECTRYVDAEGGTSLVRVYA
jgi:hypothetical protein